MRRFISTEAMAGGAVRHPWLTVFLWVALLAGAFVSAGSLGDVLTDSDEATGNSEAARAERLIDARMARADDPAAEEYVIIEAEQSAGAAAMERMVAAVSDRLRTTANVSAVQSYLD